MKKPTKKIIIIILSILFIPVLYCGMCIYSWYNPNLFNDNIEAQLPDYEIIVGTLRNYYKDKKKQGRISCDIAENYSLTYDEGNSRITIELPEKQKECLKRVCENSYRKNYRTIWMSEHEIYFWDGDLGVYGVMYTDDYSKTKKNLQFYATRVNKHWYEVYHYPNIEGGY